MCLNLFKSVPIFNLHLNKIMQDQELFMLSPLSKIWWAVSISKLPNIHHMGYLGPNPDHLHLSPKLPDTLQYDSSPDPRYIHTPRRKKLATQTPSRMLCQDIQTTRNKPPQGSQLPYLTFVCLGRSQKRSILAWCTSHAKEWSCSRATFLWKRL